MNPYLLLSLLLPMFIGFLCISIYWPWQGQESDHLLLKASLSVGMGLGISSCIYFLCLLFLGPSNIIMLIEIVILISLAALYWNKTIKRVYSASPEPDSLRISESVHHWTLPAAFYISFIVSMTLLSVTLLCYQHGMPDTWGIWNLRARFIFRSGEHWRDAFSPLLHWAHHTDYPLLIPGIIARSWQYIGYETQIIPALISMSFTSATILLIAASISILRGKSQGYLAGLILSGYGLFIFNGSFMCADVPVGFFYLATIVLLFIQDRLPKNYNLSLLAGMMASFSGWTKNEGLLFLASISIARFIGAVKSEEIKNHLLQLLYFAIGIIPVLIIIIYFKVKVVPPNDLMQSLDHRHLVAKLTDLTLHLQIIKALFKHFLSYSPMLMLAVYLACLGIKVEEVDKKGIVTSIVTLSIMFLGFYFIYLTTPYDLTWHLKTSLDRVLLQLWPSFIFTYFLIVRTPEQFMAFKKNG